MANKKRECKRKDNKDGGECRQRIVVSDGIDGSRLIHNILPWKRIKIEILIIPLKILYPTY